MFRRGCFPSYPFPRVVTVDVQPTERCARHTAQPSHHPHHSKGISACTPGEKPSSRQKNHLPGAAGRIVSKCCWLGPTPLSCVLWNTRGTGDTRACRRKDWSLCLWRTPKPDYESPQTQNAAVLQKKAESLEEREGRGTGIEGAGAETSAAGPGRECREHRLLLTTSPFSLATMMPHCLTWVL